MPNNLDKMKPNLVSLLEYLQHNFPYGEDWKSPGNKKTYTHQEVLTALEYFKIISDEEFLSLWCLWTTLDSRNLILKEKKDTQAQNIWCESALQMLAGLLKDPDLPLDKAKAKLVRLRAINGKGKAKKEFLNNKRREIFAAEADWRKSAIYLRR